MSLKGILTFAEVVKTVKLITNRSKSIIITNNFDNITSVPRITNIVSCTQEIYDALSSIDDNTLYLIVPEVEE